MLTGLPVLMSTSGRGPVTCHVRAHTLRGRTPVRLCGCLAAHLGGTASTASPLGGTLPRCGTLLIAVFDGREALRGASRHCPGHSRNTIHKLGAEDNVGVVEHPLLERHHNELRLAEMCPQHGANVLRVRKVQRRVNLIEDVHRSGLEQQQREDEGQSQQRTLTTAQLRQALLPNAAERNTDLQAVHDRPALRRHKLAGGAGQQRAEDGSEVAVHLLPCAVQSFVLLAVQLLDHTVDLGLVVLDDTTLVHQIRVLLLHGLNHPNHLLVHPLSK
mmetsp:Transcript_126419/g.307199  ORF Transcript_126419/g.307199 Transcript_126419/m.307199 type:complete len:273 (+) Transcript_126419:101-919(+)